MERTQTTKKKGTPKLGTKRQAGFFRLNKQNKRGPKSNSYACFSDPSQIEQTLAAFFPAF